MKDKRRRHDHWTERDWAGAGIGVFIVMWIILTILFIYALFNPSSWVAIELFRL